MGMDAAQRVLLNHIGHATEGLILIQIPVTRFAGTVTPLAMRAVTTVIGKTTMGKGIA